MKFKDILLLVVLLVAAVVVGGLLGSLTQSVSGLSWLSYAKTIGIPPEKPLQVDLQVLKLALGIQLKISVAQILCMVAAAIVFKKVK